METATRPAALNRRGGRGLYKLSPRELQKPGTKRKIEKLPEYMEAETVNGIIRHTENPLARLGMMLQWRAGLRVSEAIAITPNDVELKVYSELKVRQGKGSKDRIVPVHHQLARLLEVHMWGSPHSKNTPIIDVTRQTLARWYREALADAVKAGVLPESRRITTHTFRHSAARHWLFCGVPINIVALWLGHSSLEHTMRYLKLIADPGGFMERVE